MKPQIFKIVFEDADILAIEKLSSFLAQKEDRGGAEGLPEFLSRVLGYPIFPVHRLDRDVLGLMIYAKNKKAADHLSDQFRHRSVVKIYWAKVRGAVSRERDTLVHYLAKNSKNNHVTVYPRETPGAKRSELEYAVYKPAGAETELFVKLKTGRSHQIRAQLSKVGHPIVGDTKYGKAFESSVPIALRSIYLSISHPTTGESMSWLVTYSWEELKNFFEVV